MDGIDNNTMATGGGIGVTGISYTPSVDAVAEFKVKTNNYSAEFGHSAGTIISATTKSGQTSCAAPFRNLSVTKSSTPTISFQMPHTPRQPFKQNQFGFTLGGPVVIPKLYDGHSKTFFSGISRGCDAGRALLRA
ncbi:MAG: hypothetical protein L0220_33085 [Acidobacteria bacterium]|nr:hypothetical protein [Acidobacteriota bacterium]